ncbi:Spo0B domain-containing protein [Psychrobacillus sp. FSL H8-0483]|uniref:Spo0B domain-containing protein n=1 Tax=Psychrobacillus sp. FSL H8-0483 TaxID=2921389 RepID=UPI00315A55DC
MSHKPITINEILRHSMHDFLNQMHLIQMNLDMGRQEEAKNLIHMYSQKCNQFFDINNAGLLKTNEWLQTFTMKYNHMTLDVQTSLLKRGAEKYDVALRDYLDRFVQSVYPNLRGYQEQLLKVHINSDELLEIFIEITGDWSPYSWMDEISNELFRIERLVNTENQIKCKLIASERLE